MIFKYIYLVIIWICILYFSSLSQPTWQKEIEDKRFYKGYFIKQIDETTLELKHKITNRIKYVDISVQNYFLPENTLNMQFFDLPNINDSLYSHKYTYQDRILVGGGNGYPLVIGDLNHNNKLDFAGMYKVIQDYEIGQSGIVELQDNGQFTLEWLAAYTDSAVQPLAATDVDNDGLMELNCKRTQEFYNYESISPDSFPDSLNIVHEMWQFSGAVGSETFADLDNDNIIDVLYVGDDTLSPWGQKIYIVEYNAITNRFDQKYRFAPPEWRVSGFSVGDFDADGFKEIVTGSIHGDIYILENQANDSYTHIYADTISTPNAYLTCATNDIDGNGKTEFFLGGSSYWGGYSGTKIYWFEADGNNNYTKIRTFFLNGTGVLGTTELYSYDIDNDGQDDLVFAFASYVVILIWNNSLQEFELFYLDYINLGYSEIQSVNIYDVTKNNKPDLLVSIRDYWNEPRVSSFYYTNNFLTNINQEKNIHSSTFKLFKNYPNPFNNSTKIIFKVEDSIKINATIFDLTGKEIKKLAVNQLFIPGEYQFAWHSKNQFGKEVSSGIYILSIQSENFTKQQKLILLR